MRAGLVSQPAVSTSALSVPVNRHAQSCSAIFRAARFGFHLARRQDATQMLWSAYQADIRAWIDAHGGLKKDFVWMGAPDIYRYFKRC